MIIFKVISHTFYNINNHIDFIAHYMIQNRQKGKAFKKLFWDFFNYAENFTSKV